MKRLLQKIALSVLIITGMFLITAQSLSGQVDTLRNPEQYLYTEFTIARVATKVGKDLNMLANYNIVTEMIVFLQKGQIYDLTDYHNVDTIYFKNHTFIPGEKVFYEVSVSGPVSLLIRHRGTIQDPPKPAAYGGTSEVSSSSYVSYVQMSGGNIYRLKNETSLIIKEEDEYLIGKGEEITPFNKEKQFIPVFPEIRSQLKSYIRDNKIRFDREADLVKLVNYCNSLKR
jgi:hypothetical protein